MTKRVFQHRRKLAEKLIPEVYPASLMPPEELASTVKYVGSGEHKSYPSFAGEPALRSDATKCPPEWGKDEEARRQFQKALVEAIKAECVDQTLEGAYPRHVWGFFKKNLCIARLINKELGWYKAWMLEQHETPRDPAGKLEKLREGHDART